MRELTVNEVENVSGGINRNEFLTGLGLFGFGLTLLGASALGGIPLLVLIGAGTLGEAIVAGTAITAGGAGGFLMGDGLINQD
jgi:hypothetical protein